MKILRIPKHGNFCPGFLRADMSAPFAEQAGENEKQKGCQKTHFEFFNTPDILVLAAERRYFATKKIEKPKTEDKTTGIAQKCRDPDRHA